MRPVPDEVAYAAARARQEQLTKPRGALGRLEELACWFAARLHDPAPRMPACEIVVFAADHGVAAKGVSAFPQAVTAQMLGNFAAGRAAVNVLAALHHCRLQVVDVGTLDHEPVSGIRYERVREGSADLSAGAALTLEEAYLAMAIGERCARESVGGGTGLLIAGDMGIGNTTAAACLICAFSGKPAECVVGRGTGVDDGVLERKLNIVRSAAARLQREHTPPSRALHILAQAGGLEIAAMAGLYLEAARLGVPVLLDGYISAAAALAAVGIDIEARQWMLASHRSAEQGHVVALEALQLQPLLDLGLRLGEGTGALLALPVIRAALELHRGMATFAEAGVSDAPAPGR